MSLIKSRNWTKQEDEDLLAVLEQLKDSQKQATWNKIAEKVKQRNPSSRKTGKQCRQRWANQLDPKIKRNENWTVEENQILFRLHGEIGNRWSEICNKIPGRTDNCVKNHFYSTMRRGLRKINSYIENIKRTRTLAKKFKNEILNKILAICQGKNDKKYQFTITAKQLALSIKANLIQLALQLSDIDDENCQFKEELFEQICEFSRNCRKRKAKKESDMSEGSPCQEIQIRQKQMSVQQGEEDEPIIVEKNQNCQLKNIRIQQPQQVRTTHTINSTKIIQNQVPESESLIARKQKNICLQKSQSLQKSFQINPFSFIIQSVSNFENLKNSNLKNEEGPFKNSQRGEINFLSTVPDVSKDNIEETGRKNENRVIDMMQVPGQFGVVQSQNFSQRVSNIFPDLIKSQELQQSYNSFPFAKQSSHFSASPLNFDPSKGISFSPGLSPFTFCSMQAGFNYFSGWPTTSTPPADQKFKSTTFEFSVNYEKDKSREKDNDKAAQESNQRKSGIKIVSKQNSQFDLQPQIDEE